MSGRLVGTYLVIAAVVIAMLAMPLGLLSASRERERLETALERDAVVVAGLVEEELEAGATDVDPLVADYLDLTGARLVITDRDGVSVFDSDAPSVRRDYSTRPEIVQALEGVRAVGTRRSDTLGTDLLFVAVPITSGRTVYGAVRVTFSTADVDARIRSVWWVLSGLSLITLAVAALVGLRIARWVSAPTTKLAAAVSDFAEGDLTARAPADAGPPEIRDLAERFNVMAARQAELLRSQRQFVATASHQLRSPLQALRLELEGATPPEGGHPEFLARAVEETRRLGRVVDGLLAVARAEGSTASTQRVSVAGLVAGRLDLWTGLAEEQGVVLDAQPPGDDVAVRAVEGHPEQILDNLIANALDAQPDGGAIEIAVGPDGGHVDISVTDRGPGLDDADLERAFERFWRGSDSEGGTGLGLPIARQLARASGGDVTLSRGEGSGLVAVLRLPRAR